MIPRTPAFALLLVVVAATFGCDAPADGKAGEPSKAADATPTPAAAPTAVAAPAAAPSPAADPLDPCSWLTTDAINRALSASLGAGTQNRDEGRQIVTCNWSQSEPFGIVDLGVSLTPGADAFKTNMELAPAYFDGDAKPITVAGTEQAYVVVKKDTQASVIGMLVGGRFVLLQVAIAGASAEQAQALAAQFAARLK